MFYKVLPGTATHQQLQELREKMEECHHAAWDLVQQFGGVGYADYDNFGSLCGGIRYVKFENGPRKGWNKTQQENVFYLGERAKEDKQKIEALPRLTNEALNSIIGYEKWERFDPRGWGVIKTFRPGFDWSTGTFLLQVDAEDLYRPTSPDIQEITRSEYEAILNAKKEEE